MDSYIFQKKYFLIIILFKVGNSASTVGTFLYVCAQGLIVCYENYN